MLSFTRKRLVVVLVFICCSVFALAKFGPKGNANPGSTMLVPSITANNQDSITTDVDGDLRADPGDTVQYTVVINNAGTDATGVNFTDAIDSNMTLVPGSIHASPLTVDDTYTATGNVRIQVPDGASDLLANDVNPMTGTNSGLVTVAETKSSTSCTGGCSNNVVIAADGSFSYDPPAGFTGSDSFPYTVNDGGSGTATGTANITVSGMIWFVNSSAAAGGDGRLTKPFNCLVGAGCFSGSTNVAGDNIFLYSGSYTGGLALKNNQKLIGQGATTTLAGIAGITLAPNSDALPTLGGARPVLTTSAAATNAINVGAGIATTLRGFNIGNTTGTKLSSGASFTSITASEMDLSGTGMALNLASGAVNATFGSVASTSSSTQGIALIGLTGTMNLGSTTIANSTSQGILVGTTTANINFGNTSITGGTDGISMQNNSAGTRSFGTLGVSGSSSNAFLHAVGGGNVTVTGNATLSSAGSPISINSPTSGNNINFQGATSATATSAAVVGVFWNGTAGATLTFDSLSVQTNASAGINATTGGTINVTNGTGTINNTAQAAPAIFAANVALNANFSAIKSSGGSNGVSLTNVTGTSNFGSGGALSGAAGATFLMSGGNGTVTYSGTITQGNAARVVDIQNKTGGTVTLGGAVSATTGTGIILNSNTGATINFTGGISLSTGANAAFTATGGGTVSATQNNTSIVNTLTTTSGTALNVANTTIGATGLTFRSITSNGATNGIILNTTGASAGLIVSGNGGTCSSVATCTGGSISGGAIGVSLATTNNVSIDRMFIQNTTNSGVSGTAVTNFSFTNGATSGVGNGDADSSIAFNGNPVGAGGFGRNLDGTLTVTGNTFTNSFYSGVDVQCDNGTVTNANVSNNTITNPGFSGVNFVGTGNASTSFKLNKATVNQNNISGSGGNGIQFSIGNGNATGPGTVAGSLATASDIISITNNTVSSIDSTGTQAITMANTSANAASRAKTNFLIQCNGRNTGGCTAPTNTPLASSSLGTVILIGNNGHSDMSGIVDQNTIVATHTPNLGGGNGIAGGNGVGGAGAAWTPNLTLTVTNNAISGTDGNGVLLVDRATNGIAKMKIANNTVGMAVNVGGSARPGIRVDAGNNTAGENCSVFLNVFGNAAVGSNGAGGIGVRKQGTNAAVDNFGIFDAAGGPTLNSPPTNTEVTNFIDALNPGSSPVSFVISGSNFTRDTTQAPPRPAFGGDGTIETASYPDKDFNFLNASYQPPTDFLSAIQPWTNDLLAFRHGPSASAADKSLDEANIQAESVDNSSANAVNSSEYVDNSPENANDSSEKPNNSFEYVDNSPENANNSSEKANNSTNEANNTLLTRLLNMISPTALAEDMTAAEGDSIKDASKPEGTVAGVVVNGNGSGFTLAGGKTLTITFRATLNPYTAPTPQYTSVSNQGSVAGSNFATVLTNDPDTGTAGDATVTAVDNTTVVVTATPNPVIQGENVTFTATLTGVPTRASDPSGTVQFKDNGVDMGTPVPVVVGTVGDNVSTAQFTTLSLSAGSHTITALYSGGGSGTLSYNPNTGVLAGFGVATPTATNTATNTATATSTATFTPTPTSTATNTATPTSTATSTATDTPTPATTETSTATATATATSTPAESVSGTVTYGNAIGTPTPRAVPNVLMSGAGSPPVSTLTGLDGTYLLTGFGAGAYTVTPSKTGGQNGAITSFDAALVAQHVSGPPLPHLAGNQVIVADVSGNGIITSFDAAMIASFVVSSPRSGSTGNWIFNPVNRMYASVTTDISGEDYSALLMGEVTGNWNDPNSPPPGRRSIGYGPERYTEVELPSLEATAGKEIVVPINVKGIANKGVISYEFDLRYDSSVIQPVGDVADIRGTASRGLSVVVNPNEPGLLRVVVYGAYPIDENGVLLNLRFAAVGSAGSISPISLKRILFNEGEPRVTAADGEVRLF